MKSNKKPWSNKAATHTRTSNAHDHTYQVVHGLTGQKFPDAGPKHFATVSRPRVGSQPSALELYFPALTIDVDHLAQCDGGAVAKLPCKVPKLVTAVVMGCRVAAG